MAKAGKLTKLRSALKKMNSFSKLRRDSSVNSTPAPSDDCHVSSTHNIGGGLHTVYVGKSLRRYHVTSEVLDHPVIQELVDRSDGCDEETIVIGCEVVLFEHLLWMLQNIDTKSESLEDLVGLYAY
ncbi:auxin-responsive protein SAUR41-like [Chenopodium quinoa]|uniref:SAUR family protein n=1 Tax=Chenopodium quinoa TaxID=63459 RepID=A0A803KQX8_CHEQI|nr:auxin-responsive protein SAUR41-like [Chenopodium quinoa]